MLSIKGKNLSRPQELYPEGNYVRKERNSDPMPSANIEETGGKLSELNREEVKRKECRYGCRQDRYHTVVKGCTDSLDTDELDLYRYMIGGMQGK